MDNMERTQIVANLDTGSTNVTRSSTPADTRTSEISKSYDRGVSCRRRQILTQDSAAGLDWAATESRVAETWDNYVEEDDMCNWLLTKITMDLTIDNATRGTWRTWCGGLREGPFGPEVGNCSSWTVIHWIDQMYAQDYARMANFLEKWSDEVRLESFACQDRDDKDTNVKTITDWDGRGPENSRLRVTRDWCDNGADQITGQWNETCIDYINDVVKWPTLQETLWIRR